ncbi:hypothetical protein DAI22_11g105550 [Oryza sativa Japonica Group]|nr:hypothetical protein DAI22_11g105550 [Oryza sativa Japonica Group]
MKIKIYPSGYRPNPSTTARGPVASVVTRSRPIVTLHRPRPQGRAPRAAARADPSFPCPSSPVAASSPQTDLGEGRGWDGRARRPRQRVGEGQHAQDGRGRHRRHFLRVRRRRSFLRDRRHHRRQLTSSPCTSMPRPSRRRGRHRQRRAPPATPLPGGGGWGRSRAGKEEGLGGGGGGEGGGWRGRWVGGEEIEKRGDSGWLKGISQRA